MNVNLPVIQRKEEVSKNDSYEKQKKIYDYFSTRIPRSQIETKLKIVKDERFLFFIKYGALRRYDGDCDVIYVEIPQIPKKLVVYRRPCARMKSIDKFNLSRKDLPHIPLFEGEENLQYLSLEMNQITKIDQLISLNNLVYLNLYCNKITEIENLQTTTKLKVLLLGKNNIEKIKNLHFLHELEILDLHSNKIKQIENLSQLRKLRILNLANNQIASISELLYNRNLEELNIRKNLIGVIPSLSGNWEKIRKLNIGKNLISKMEYLNELKKLKNLIELIIEENPILLVKDSNVYVKNLPVLINKPQNQLNKSQTISAIKRENTGTILQGNNILNKTISTNNKNCLISSCNGSIKTETSLQIQNAELNVFQSKTITRTIRNNWEEEMKKIINLGFNGYNNKRYKEHNITTGHVELNGDTKMILYGDAMKVLTHEDFQRKITSISFNYFYFDNIMSKKYIETLKKFTKLTSIRFCDNNIFSFYQLIKLENIISIENINITDNEICTSYLLKYFLIYRIQNLKQFNDSIITEEDISVAKQLFEYFDKCISLNEKTREEIKTETTTSSNYVTIEKKEDNGIKKTSPNEKEKTIEPIHKKQLKKEDTLNLKYYQFLKDNLCIAIKEILDDFSNQE